MSMNNYQIKIKGMHCSGCKNLISLNLQEQGFEEIEVNLETNIGSFKSNESLAQTKILAENAILELGEKYTLEEIKQI